MLFNSPQFVLFFLLFLLCYVTAPVRFRAGILLGASVLFYTLWIPAYSILLAFDIGVNYFLLRAMVRSPHPKRYLAASIAFTLALLVYFKYAALIVTTLAPLLEPALGLSPSVPEIFLPLGISFYSFQIIALCVDTYRGEIRPVDRFSRYALFVSFFPQLIAGPILRGREFLPQLEAGGEMNADRRRRGIWLVVVGLGKKVVLADFLLAPFVDDVFGPNSPESWRFNLIALYSFAFQIYFDFSGYTDMARGMALLIGFELPLNFAEPYLSRSPAELWERWHITLSRWFRDYVYIGLGGNRVGGLLTARNLLVTMLLGGLWHGASWTFVIWGGLHGLLLGAHRMLFGRAQARNAPLSWRDVPSILVLFHIICLFWVFFRSPDATYALHFLSTLGGLKGSLGWPAVQTGIVLACAGLHVAERAIRLHWASIRVAASQRAWAGALEGAAIGSILAAALWLSGGGGDFIYFQF